MVMRVGLRGMVVFSLIFGMYSCTMTGLNFGRRADVPVVDGVMHTTKEGETLGAIARAYDVSIPLLQRVNNVNNPNKIPAGSRLFIPGATKLRLVKVEEPPKELTEVVEEKGIYHTVLPGETLIAIAKAYDMKPHTLQQVNNISDPNQIRVNDKLWIPGATEVQDVEITPVTVVSPEPEKTKTSEPRVIVDVRPEPTPTKTTKEEAEKPTAEFPGKVSTVGPVRMQWPLKDTFRIEQSYNPSDMNYGIDLGADIGTPVYAAADGVVAYVGGVTDDMGDYYGNFIMLYHGDEKSRGLRTLYSHNSENLVEIGQKVKRGEMIGKVGNTGQTTTAEGGVLHFEIRELDDPLDPMKVLPPL